MAGTQFNFEVFNWIGANQSLLSTSYLLILSTKSEIFCRYFLKYFTELFFHNSNFPWWLWWAMPDRYVKNFCQQGRNYVNQFGNKGTSHAKWMQWHSEFWKLLILKFFLIDQREQEMSTQRSLQICGAYGRKFADGVMFDDGPACSACSAVKTANCNLPSW